MSRKIKIAMRSHSYKEAHTDLNWSQITIKYNFLPVEDIYSGIKCQTPN
jgi:hypothetical protein